MVLGFTTELLIVIFVGAVFFFVAFTIRRTLTMYRITIKKDYRNPDAEPRKVYAIFDRNEYVIYIYNRMLAFRKSDTVPYFEPRPFAARKSIDCVQGISGKQGDNNIVPIGRTLMSGAMCDDMATDLSNSIVKELVSLFPNIKDARINQIAEVFTGKWVLSHFGVTEIQDANLLMQHHKVQIAAARSISQRYRDNNLSWLAKNMLMVQLMVFFIIMAICTVIFWNGISANITGQAKALQGQNTALGPTLTALTHYLGLHVANGTAVAAPTTIPVSNGTQTVT